MKMLKTIKMPDRVRIKVLLGKPYEGVSEKYKNLEMLNFELFVGQIN